MTNNMINQHTEMRDQLQERHEEMVNGMFAYDLYAFVYFNISSLYVFILFYIQLIMI